MEKFGWEGNFRSHLAQPSPLDSELCPVLDPPWVCQEHQKWGPSSSQGSKIRWDQAGPETLLISPPCSTSRLHFPPCDQSTLGFSLCFQVKPLHLGTVSAKPMCPTPPAPHLAPQSQTGSSDISLLLSLQAGHGSPKARSGGQPKLCGGSRNNPNNVNSQ